MVCSMRPPRGYRPGAQEPGLCYLKGRKSGFFAGILKGRKDELASVETLNNVELRPLARKYNVRGYAKMSLPEMREAITNAITEQLP